MGFADLAVEPVGHNQPLAAIPLDRPDRGAHTLPSECTQEPADRTDTSLYPGNFSPEFREKSGRDRLAGY